jgi:hypothetical protein
MKTNTREMGLFNFKKTSFIILFVILLNYTFLSSEAQAQIFLNRVASIGGSGLGYDVDIDGDYCYITGNNGYIVVDIENPTKPKKIGNFELDEAAFGIFVEESIAYVAAGGYGLYITNISNPTNPTLLGYRSSEGICNNVFASGNYAYVSNYDMGLQIFNIEDLENPVMIEEYSSCGRADAIAIRENCAYLACPSNGVILLNITTPSSPQIIEFLVNTSGAKSLKLYQDLLFVGCYSSNVVVFNISTPSDPILLGIHTDNDDGEAQGVSGNSTHLYVADNFGVEYLDISNLPSITKIAEYRQGISSAHSIDFKGNFLFIAGGSIRGSLVFEVSNTQRISFIGIYVGVPIAVAVISLSFIFLRRYKVKAKRI